MQAFSRIDTDSWCLLAETFRYRISWGPAAKVCASYPFLEQTGVIDDIIPKKEQGAIAKW